MQARGGRGLYPRPGMREGDAEGLALREGEEVAGKDEVGFNVDIRTPRKRPSCALEKCSTSICTASSEEDRVPLLCRLGRRIVASVRPEHPSGAEPVAAQNHAGGALHHDGRWLKMRAGGKNDAMFGGVSRWRRKTSLLALAKTATTFAHSALNGLWEQQSTLVNVLRCLPADLLAADGSSFHFLRPVTQSDLERVLVHSARVRLLQLAPDAATPAISGLLEQIQPFLPQGFLFPNLQSISFDGPTERERRLLGPHLRLFLPASVREISMFVEESGNWSLLPLIWPLNSSFTSVTLSVDICPNRVKFSLISTFLQALDQVTYLALPTLDPAALEHLGSLGSLKSLEIANGAARDLLPGFIRPAGFPSLTNLSFHQTPFEFIGALIHCLSNSPVARLYLGSTDLPTESAMRALCLTLSTHIAHSTLVNVVMQQMVTNDTSDVRDIFDIHTISPLFCFGRIQTLDLEAPGGFKLDDAAVWDLARAFPALRRLSLTSFAEMFCASGVTLGRLRAFATHCPYLGIMCIAFNATFILPATTPDVFQTQLPSLEVLNSPISSEPAHVARFLSGIFPGLVEIINDPDNVQPSPPRTAKLGTRSRLCYLCLLIYAREERLRVA
ncbi:hypothetical protein C8J57DRAFT_1465481 [Mycena rebaudengoi]|nr:hypothetical protein C8J57DRAFT_1465481 [Mycena rebaudengoi]